MGAGHDGGYSAGPDRGQAVDFRGAGIAGGYSSRAGVDRDPDHRPGVRGFRVAVNRGCFGLYDQSERSGKDENGGPGGGDLAGHRWNPLAGTGDARDAGDVAVMIFGIVSAADYFRKFWRRVDDQVKLRRRRELLRLERQKQRAAAAARRSVGAVNVGDRG